MQASTLWWRPTDVNHLVRQNLQNKKKGIELSENEIVLNKAINRNYEPLEEEVKAWLDLVEGDVFSERNTTDVLKILEEQKPGIYFLSE